MVWPQRWLLVWLISNYKGQFKLSLQTHRQKGVMQAFIAQKLLVWPQRECVNMCAPSQLLLNKEKHQLGFPLQHSLSEMEQKKQRERCRSPASSCPVACVTCRLLLIYLVVHTFAVESYVNSECGGVMVRLEQGLLVRFVPHHEVQGSRTLMKEDTILYIIHFVCYISALMRNHVNCLQALSSFCPTNVWNF